MNPIHRLVARDSLGTDLLRLVLCGILFTHGAVRLARGEAPILGDILREHHLPVGTLLAYLVCLAETGGALLLAFRYVVLPVGAILASIYLTGVVLFHRHNGFFVVGPGEGGWEYSLLILACLVATMWSNWSHRWAPFIAAEPQS